MAGGACVCQASPQRQGHSAAHLALWLPGPMDSCGRPGSTSFEVEVKASLGTAPGAHQHHRAGHKTKTLPSSSANKLFLGFSKKNCQLFQNSHGENFHPLTASWPGSWEQRGQCSHGQRPSGLAPPVPVSTQTHCHQRRPLLTVYTEEDTFSPAHSATASRANPRAVCHLGNRGQCPCKREWCCPRSLLAGSARTGQAALLGLGLAHLHRPPVPVCSENHENHLSTYKRPSQSSSPDSLNLNL